MQRNTLRWFRSSLRRLGPVETIMSSSTKFPLVSQYAVVSSPQAKVWMAFLSTALSDALGGPTEFHPRFSFEPVTSLQPNTNFGLGSGVWTDDTSMMLCLARSIASGGPEGFDERDQLERYTRWRRDGELSAVGQCFDIGNTIARALTLYEGMRAQGRSTEEVLNTVRRNLGGKVFSGNGSLMRVLPVGLAYWRLRDSDDGRLREYARRSSCTTHPSAMCVEACEVWSLMVARIMRDTCDEEKGRKTMSKIDLLEWLAGYSYSIPELKKALTLSSDAPTLHSGQDPEEREAHYWPHHPILKLITEVHREQAEPSENAPELALPSAAKLPSSGYVLHTLVAALYCFFSTSTFEAGAIMAANLGDDSDTVGAIYGGLAGVWYSGTESEDTDNLYWSGRVREWKEGLVGREIVLAVADELVKFQEGCR